VQDPVGRSDASAAVVAADRAEPPQPFRQVVQQAEQVCDRRLEQAGALRQLLGRQRGRHRVSPQLGQLRVAGELGLRRHDEPPRHREAEGAHEAAHGRQRRRLPEHRRVCGAQAAGDGERVELEDRDQFVFPELELLQHAREAGSQFGHRERRGQVAQRVAGAGG
jgi:hypothetical protein